MPTFARFVDGITGHFEVSLDEENNSVRARIQFGDPRSLFFIVERIRAMFDLNSDWTDIAAILKVDPALTRLVESAPGLRVPGCWSGFELATRAILGQQITVRGGTALAGKHRKSVRAGLQRLRGDHAFVSYSGDSCRSRPQCDRHATSQTRDNSGSCQRVSRRPHKI